MEIKPFIKWVGGKTKCVDRLLAFAPRNYGTYYEPFVGSGVMLLNLKPSVAVIGDLNKELISAYEAFQDKEQYKAMVALLRNYQASNSKEFYDSVRKLDRIPDWDSHELYVHAGRFIYLTKTSFNGLYRTNSKGEFNAPYNNAPNIVIYQKRNLDAVRRYLTESEITIKWGDYQDTLKGVRTGDFVYLDPPPDKDSCEYVDCTRMGFDRKEQERLAHTYDELNRRGVRVMMTNSNTEYIRARYSGYHIEQLQNRASVGSTGTRRHNIDEIVIRNY